MTKPKHNQRSRCKHCGIVVFQRDGVWYHYAPTEWKMCRYAMKYLGNVYPSNEEPNITTHAEPLEKEERITRLLQEIDKL